MPDVINNADIDTLFSRTIVMYKGRPVYVHRNPGRQTTVEYLEDNRVEVVQFNLDDFKPLPYRLGYVNTSLGCAYVYRRPVRRYQVGLSAENVHILEAPTQFNREISGELATMRSRFFVDTIKGQFPDLESAFLNAHALQTSFAFDRQFCVSFDGSIGYRGREVVGTFTEGDIKFTKGKEYLKSLLDGSYGKSC